MNKFISIAAVTVIFFFISVRSFGQPPKKTILVHTCKYNNFEVYDDDLLSYNTATKEMISGTLVQHTPFIPYKWSEVVWAKQGEYVAFVPSYGDCEDDRGTMSDCTLWSSAAFPSRNGKTILLPPGSKISLESREKGIPTRAYISYFRLSKNSGIEGTLCQAGILYQVKDNGEIIKSE